jgi:hypothetical protein
VLFLFSLGGEGGGGFGGDSHSVETKCEEKVLVGVAMKLLILCLWFVSV